jgi:acetyltransferase-like isoleucine patch superfamily enzyme
MLDQPMLLEPLLRLMPLPHTLMRHAPLSAERRVFSVKLRDAPQASGLGVDFDETSLLTVAEGMQPGDAPVKLNVRGGKKHFSGVHLAVLSTKGQIKLVLGDDDVKVFIGSETMVRAVAHLLHKPTMFIGDHTTIGQARLNVGNADLVVGQDCQIMGETIVQCNDPHPMIDLSNGELLNGARQRVYLGRHVLVNRRSMLLPGVRIGDGAIVQAGTVVARDVPPNTCVGGSPAVTLREQVGWERDYAVTAHRPMARKAGS